MQYLYRGRIFLNNKVPKLQDAQASVVGIHQALTYMFDFTDEENRVSTHKNHNLLWRLDPPIERWDGRTGPAQLIFHSTTAPNISQAFPGAEQNRDYQLINSPHTDLIFRPGHQLHVRVQGNPIRMETTRTNAPRPIKKRVAITTRTEVRAWFNTKFRRAGAELLNVTNLGHPYGYDGNHVSDIRTKYGDQSEITLNVWVCDGTIAVRDPHEFKKALINGFPSLAKAYGCGLLNIRATG